MDSTGAAVYMGSNEEVAQRLGITPAGLRRLADIYGVVYEPLQRDTHYNNRRLWTLEAVERLEAARALVKADRARSIKAALMMLKGGSEASHEAMVLSSKEVSKDPLLLAVLEHVQRLEALTETNRAATQPLLDEVRLLREQVEKQNELLAELTRPQLEQGKRVGPLEAVRRFYRWFYRKD